MFKIILKVSPVFLLSDSSAFLIFFMFLFNLVLFTGSKSSKVLLFMLDSAVIVLGMGILWCLQRMVMGKIKVLICHFYNAIDTLFMTKLSHSSETGRLYSFETINALSLSLYSNLANSVKGECQTHIITMKSRSAIQSSIFSNIDCISLSIYKSISRSNLFHSKALKNHIAVP